MAMDLAVLRERPRVARRTPYLAVTANLGMLLGLLGTVTGLTRSYHDGCCCDPSCKARMLAQQISEAMNCTAFGLFTGITGLAAFAWLNGKTQTALDDISEVKKNVSNLLFQAKAALRG
jgi:biopolymer transport protein ExbB/TolQ